MDFMVLIVLLISVCVTIAGLFAATTKGLIYLLSLQAFTIGIAELLLLILHSQLGRELVVNIDFFSLGMEWLFSFALTPLVFYYGMARTENKRDSPIVSSRWGSFLIIAIISFLFVIGIWIAPSLPRRLEVLPTVLLLLLISMIITIKSKNYLKIFIGVNMVENSLLLSMVEGSIYLTSLFLLFVVIIDLICIYAAKVYYKENGTLSIKKNGVN